MRTNNPKQQPKPSTDSLKKGDSELNEEALEKVTGGSQFQWGVGRAIGEAARGGAVKP
jgi:hypothetical protein